MTMGRGPRRQVALFETAPGRGDIFGSERLSLLAGDLEGAGQRVRVFVLGAGPSSRKGLILHRVLSDRFVKASDAVVFYRTAPLDLLEGLRRAHPSVRLCLFESGTPFGTPSGVEVIPGGRLAALRAVGRRRGCASSSIDEPGLYVPAGLPFRPVLERASVGAGSRRPEPAGVPELLGRLGCPYRKNVRLNPAFRGVRLGTGVLREDGCSMCLFRTSGPGAPGRGRGRRPSAPTALGKGVGAPGAAAWVGSIVRQLRLLLGRSPTLQRFRIGDHAPLDFLGPLLDRLRREGLGGLTLAMDPRVDQLLSRRWDWAGLARRARLSGSRLDFTCVGFENFSQPELDRLNKGTTVAQNVAAIRLLRGLRDAAPDVFTRERASAGFILFTPWTTVPDLEANLRMVRSLDFAEFRRDFAATRLRLYPEMPVYHLAARDGLLLPSAPEGWAVRPGYAADHPWRFASAGAAAVHAAVLRLLERGMGSGGDASVLEHALLLSRARRAGS